MRGILYRLDKLVGYFSLCSISLPIYSIGIPDESGHSSRHDFVRNGSLIIKNGIII
ncbi:MAG: hypothetical protein JKX79_02995 [Labilibaculum sp.]|nr:hypothetical protein [Labilibaculum sp.]